MLMHKIERLKTEAASGFWLFNRKNHTAVVITAELKADAAARQVFGAAAAVWACVF